MNDKRQDRAGVIRYCLMYGFDKGLDVIVNDV